MKTMVKVYKQPRQIFNLKIRWTTNKKQIQMLHQKQEQHNQSNNKDYLWCQHDRSLHFLNVNKV